jgi:hypothetical protein
MILLNFGYPMSDEQREIIEGMISGVVDAVIEIPVYFDNAQLFAEQIRDLFCEGVIPLDALQSGPVLVNLPSHNVIAALLLAELHGRMGRFPTIIRFGPLEDSLPVRYAVREVVDLQRVRDSARGKRFDRDA